jgi:hypothetical protein
MGNHCSTSNNGDNQTRRAGVAPLPPKPKKHIAGLSDDFQPNAAPSDNQYSDDEALFRRNPKPQPREPPTGRTDVLIIAKGTSPGVGQC